MVYQGAPGPSVPVMGERESPVPDSAGIGNRETPRFPIWPGTARGNRGYPASESEGCGRLPLDWAGVSDTSKQTTGTMSNDALEKIACLRNSRMAVTVLKTT
jgi:hypothetical protein